jgi:phosphosulfolactate synthase
MRPESVPTERFLRGVGVQHLPPRTAPFDPGYDHVTVEAHLEQSAHLIEMLKLSMACWIIADEASTRQKIAAAKTRGVRVVSGGCPFEIAAAQRKLGQYLDLCAGIGFARIEAGAGFTDLQMTPADVVRMARDRGLEVQFELGRKDGGPFDARTTEALIEQGIGWLEAGAICLVIEARESARGVGLFDADGRFDARLAERFVSEFGFEVVAFEAPTKSSQFALLDRFGPAVHLSNVRLEELLRVEIYRRGLHADAFGKPNLRPAADDVAAVT